MANEEKILKMLGTMQENLTRVNDRLGRLEASQDKMQKDLDGVKASQDKMQEDLDGVRKGLDTIKTTQNKMEKDLTRVRGILEVEVDLKVRALFNGHAMLNDKLERLDGIEKKLEKVSVKVDATHAATMENIRDITHLKRAQ